MARVYFNPCTFQYQDTNPDRTGTGPANPIDPRAPTWCWKCDRYSDKCICKENYWKTIEPKIDTEAQ